MTTPTTPAIVVLVGPVGAGKTTWAEQRFTPTRIVCLDELRGRVCDDQADQTATDTAALIQDTLLTARCARRLLTVVDATNLRADVRAKFLALAAAYGLFTVAVVFDTPIGVCLERNAGREHPVPEPVVHRTHRQFSDTVPAAGPVPRFHQTVRISPSGNVQVFGLSPKPCTAEAVWLR